MNRRMPRWILAALAALLLCCAAACAGRAPAPGEWVPGVTQEEDPSEPGNIYYTICHPESQGDDPLRVVVVSGPDGTSLSIVHLNEDRVEHINITHADGTVKQHSSDYVPAETGA